MQQRKGRPPIDIEDLQPEEEPEEDIRPKKGSLSYSGGGAPPRRGRSQKIDNGGNMAQALIAAIAAVAISVFVSFNMFVPKTDIQAMTDKVNQAATQAQSSATQAVSGIQSQVSNIIVNYATKADLANYATKAEITGLKAPDLSGYYSKTEIDDLLKKKANVGTVVTPTTTTPTGTTTSTGTGYTVTMDKTQVISMTTDTGNKDVTLTIVNNSGAGGNPTLLISLLPLSPSAYDTSKITTYNAYSTLSGFTAVTAGTKQNMSDVPTLVQKLFWIAPSYYMDSGSSKTIWMHFDVKTTDVVTWNLTVQVLN